MRILFKIFIFSTLIFIVSCSASYEKLTNSSFETKDGFSKYLLNAYKEKADFEAIEMHDMNSAKLYAEKALSSVNGEKIYPEKISYWKVTPEKRFDLIKGYNNLMLIYNDAVYFDPFNLAKAISSLDCWSEQQEENWQTWDIDACRNDFLDAMHALYNIISKNKKEEISKNSTNSADSVSLVTKDEEENILQIVYFDFDKSKLSSVSISEINNFIKINKDKIKKYIVVGHTDTAGTREYNQKLSQERAETIKKLLINLDILDNNIKILGRGEDDLSVKTEDNTPYPANRRAEISLLN